ncbi:TIGR03643 family protein [bacterium]|nr:TIGR03643 family protein [bacterium]
MFKLRYEKLSPGDISKIIKRALGDEFSFDDICKDYDLVHGDIIKIMRKNISRRAFKNWRQRSTSTLRNGKKHSKKQTALS